MRRFLDALLVAAGVTAVAMYVTPALELWRIALIGGAVGVVRYLARPQQQ